MEGESQRVRLLEDELQAERERASRLERALVNAEKLSGLGSVAGGLGHELTNPLGRTLGNVDILTGYVDALQRLLATLELPSDAPPRDPEAIARLKEEIEYDYLRADLPQLMRAVRDGVQQALNIVSTLRLFLRDEPQVAPACHRAFCQAGIRAAAPELRHKKIDIQTRFSEMPNVLCSATAMEIVVTNVVSNAAQAIEAAGQIKVESERVGTRCRITITDDGPGMTPEVAARVFEPFFTTKPAGKGLGIGLPLSRALVEKQGGEMQARSTPGAGTIITFELPLEA